jgi:hypothetical protein
MKLIKSESVDYKRFYTKLDDTIKYLQEVNNRAKAQNLEAHLDIDVDYVQFLLHEIDETKAPENWWCYHASGCGTQYRGCAPDCPKDKWEETGIWRYNWK